MIEKNNMTLATKLKDLRKNYCMTQDGIAELLGMSRTSFSKYENGAANPPLAVLRKLAAIYNVPIEYLIHDEQATLILNSNDDNVEPDLENPLKYFSQLTPDERMLILKLRLMQKEEKESIIRKINSDE